MFLYRKKKNGKETNQRKYYKPNCPSSLPSPHKAKQLCRSPLLGILLRCCFLHERKQRALSFSRLALLLINRGHRATRTESSLRACSTHNNTIASCGDISISQCSVAAWIIARSLVQEVRLVLSLQQAEEVVSQLYRWVAVGLSLRSISNSAGSN